MSKINDPDLVCSVYSRAHHCYVILHREDQVDDALNAIARFAKNRELQFDTVDAVLFTKTILIEERERNAENKRSV